MSKELGKASDAHDDFLTYVEGSDIDNVTDEDFSEAMALSEKYMKRSPDSKDHENMRLGVRHALLDYDPELYYEMFPNDADIPFNLLAGLDDDGTG